jgi:3-dehydroquinate synthase
MQIQPPFNYKGIATQFYFNSKFHQLQYLIDYSNAVFITDENVFEHHATKFKNLNTIVIKAGEQFKVQKTLDSIVQQLIQFKANRKTILIGVGGGVVTDITGYVASVFMRGIEFGFVPTTLLCLVDASIGGKNGIDVGEFKNMVGTINQPKFILHDISFLNTLPENEWQNGFAEIIKHSAIADKKLFKELTTHQLKHYRSQKIKTNILVQQNAKQKLKIVADDVHEKGDRKLLNFGHTLGHAIETTYKLSHGQAISIGMMFACTLSEKILSFKQTVEVEQIIQQYGLPTHIKFNPKRVFEILVMDKKREQNFIHFILLEKIGKAVIKKVSLAELQQALKEFNA